MTQFAASGPVYKSSFYSLSKKDKLTAARLSYTLLLSKLSEAGEKERKKMQSIFPASARELSQYNAPIIARDVELFVTPIYSPVHLLPENPTRPSSVVPNSTCKKAKHTVLRIHLIRSRNTWKH
jgi:hypothetical protein